MALKKLDEATARKESTILFQSARKLHGTEETASWVRSSASELSTTTWSATLHNAAPAQLRSLLIMCHELQVPLPIVRKMLLARGEKIIARMLKGD